MGYRGQPVSGPALRLHVFNLGRNHPAIKQAMMEFFALDWPSLVKMDCPLLAGLLAEELVKRMPPGLEAVFFGNSGADAVDTAIKFARYATGRPRVVYLHHAFHGLTLGTLSINGGEAFKKGFEPLIPGAVIVESHKVVPGNSPEKLYALLPFRSAHPPLPPPRCRYAAQGEGDKWGFGGGGLRPPPPNPPFFPLSSPLRGEEGAGG